VAGVALIAASFDTPEDNAAFADKYGYEWTILSDVDHSVGERYETKRHPDESSPEFAKRRTFVIDPEGTIRKVYRVTDIPAHPSEVLDDLRALGAMG
jgi:thioredoxin-dependent peroxiredoxin